MPLQRARRALESALIAIFIALVFIATSLFYIETPATRGFFNFGETMVYTAALVGGWLVGAVAGGVGSALADIYLGFGYYAPGTLVIKGFEGFIVGYLYSKLRLLRGSRRIAVTASIAAVSSTIIYIIGTKYYTGKTLLSFAGLSIGGYTLIPGGTISIYIPQLLWLVLSIVLGVAVLAIGLTIDPAISSAVLAMTIGGIEMVLGYFAYQVLILKFGVYAAATEIPVNLGQYISGVVVGLAITSALRRAGIIFPLRS